MRGRNGYLPVTVRTRHTGILRPGRCPVTRRQTCAADAPHARPSWHRGTAALGPLARVLPPRGAQVHHPAHVRHRRRGTHPAGHRECRPRPRHFGRPRGRPGAARRLRPRLAGATCQPRPGHSRPVSARARPLDTPPHRPGRITRRRTGHPRRGRHHPGHRESLVRRGTRCSPRRRRRPRSPHTRAGLHPARA